MCGRLYCRWGERGFLPWSELPGKLGIDQTGELCGGRPSLTRALVVTATVQSSA